MLNILYNMCSCIILWSLVFILVQREVMFMVFSLLLFIFMAALSLVIVSFEFLALVLVIIYVGVIAVLFLFVCLIYKLPVIVPYITSNSFTLLLVIILSANICALEEHALVNKFVGEGDLTYLVGFINQYPHLIIWCGFLLLMSIICSLIIVNKFQVKG